MRFDAKLYGVRARRRDIASVVTNPNAFSMPSATAEERAELLSVVKSIRFER